MNTVNLIGNLTRDPEVRHTTSGMPITQFGIAYNGRRKDASGEWVDEPHFFDVKAWGERFEKLAAYLEKGKKVGVSGRLTQERWEQDGQKRSKVVIVAHDITFASAKGEGDTAVPKPEDDDVPASQFEPVGNRHDEDDDIPF